MKSTIEIRSLTIEDYESIFALWKRTPGMGLRSVDDTREGIDKFLKRNPHTNFILTDGERAAGVILCGHDGRRAYIYHMVVDTEYRNKRYGSRLLDTVLTALKQEGINKAALVVYADNELGNGFWESKGFTVREDLTYRNRWVQNEE